MDLDIETYAAMMAELAAAGDERAELLARHGLDEASWDAIDSRWQARLSEALEQDGDGVAELVSTYAAAYEAAQRTLGPPMSLEQFAQVTRLLHASGDIGSSVAKVGVTLAAYVKASAHWSRRIAEDPELERRFAEVLRDGS